MESITVTVKLLAPTLMVITTALATKVTLVTVFNVLIRVRNHDLNRAQSYDFFLAHEFRANFFRGTIFTKIP